MIGIWLEFGRNDSKSKSNLGGFSLTSHSYQIPTIPTILLEFRSEFGQICSECVGESKVLPLNCTLVISSFWTPIVLTFLSPLVSLTISIRAHQGPWSCRPSILPFGTASPLENPKCLSHLETHPFPLSFFPISVCLTVSPTFTQALRHDHLS